VHLGVPPAWRAFPEAAIPERLPFQDAAGIQCELRWLDVGHGVHRHHHPDGQMVDEIPAVRRVHLDVGAGKSADRGLRHPEDGRPAAFCRVVHGIAGEAGSAQPDSAAAPCKPDAAQSAA